MNMHNTKGAVAEALAELLTPKGVEFNKVDPDIQYEGKKITLPDDPGKMDLRAAAAILIRKAEDEETLMKIHEMIEAYPMDGAVAFVKAMKELYGWSSPVPTMTFFGPKPPKLITVQIASELDTKDHSIQVPWGEFKIPGIENTITTTSTNTENGPVFVVYGQVRKKEQLILRELADKAREILREASIYKGKAIRLKVDSEGKMNSEIPPSFLSTRYIRPEELILNDDERSQVETSLWAVIRNTDLARKHNIPLKRGILFEGPYGGGKTMTANVTSLVCVQNKWTYILLDDVRALKDALLFAKRYAPAVIFAEDAERVAGSRDQRGNDLLNTIDGVLSKNSEVITVLTTNHVEKIERAMLRPGRLDAVISIRPPEGPAVQKLLKLYTRGLMAPGQDLTEVGEALAGNIPATIREVAERAKLGMIDRGDEKITARDLLISARSMTRHLELLNFQPPVISAGDALATSLRNVIGPNAQLKDEKAVMEILNSLDNTIRVNVIANLMSQKEALELQKKESTKLNGTFTKIKEKVDEIHDATVN